MSDASQASLPLPNAPAGESMPLQRDRGRRSCARAGCERALAGRQKRWCSETCRWKVWDVAHPRLPGRARQAALPGESRVERRFAEWIESTAGQYVEAEVVKLAQLDRNRRGMKRGEINYYLAYVRRNSWGLAKDDDGYRCNNNHRSLLARRIMARHLGLEGFFEIRGLRGVR